MKLTYLHVALIFWLAVILLWATIASAQEHGSETYRLKIRADVTAYCNTGSEYVKCEDIPVFELQPEDYEEPPTPAEQWASVVAWRKQGE